MVDTRTAAEKAADSKATKDDAARADAMKQSAAIHARDAKVHAVKEGSLHQKLAAEVAETTGLIVKEGSLAQALSAEQLAFARLEEAEAEVGEPLWYIVKGVFKPSEIETLLIRARSAVKQAAAKREEKEVAVKDRPPVSADRKPIVLEPAEAPVAVKDEPEETDESVFIRYISDAIIAATRSTNRP